MLQYDIFYRNKLNSENVRKQLKTNQNILKMLSIIGNDKKRNW